MKGTMDSGPSALAWNLESHGARRRKEVGDFRLRAEEADRSTRVA